MLPNTNRYSLYVTIEGSMSSAGPISELGAEFLYAENSPKIFEYSNIRLQMIK